jgi:hypothetical protein
MHKRKLVLGPLLVFLLATLSKAAFGQAAAEAGIVSSLSATSTTSAASSLSAATNRALQGQANKMASITTSHPATTTTAHRAQAAGPKVSTGSKGSTTRTKTTHTGVATTTDHGTKLPDGIVHVWPENALTPAPPQ